MQVAAVAQLSFFFFFFNPVRIMQQCGKNSFLPLPCGMNFNGTWLYDKPLLLRLNLNTMSLTSYAYAVIMLLYD